jgi:hypothetical protein
VARRRRRRAASWRAHDGGRKQRTACPLLYRYRLTHTYCSLARLPLTHPFVCAPILLRHFQVLWRARLPPPRVLLPHTCTQDGWFLHPKRRPVRLPRRTIFSRCICRCSRMRVRLPLPCVLLPHTCTQDGWFLHPKRRPVRLPRRTMPAVYVGVGVVECASASLPPASSFLTHTHRMDGFCIQNSDQFGSLARLSFPNVYVGVLECASASPYTYSSSTNRFPYENAPIEDIPLSLTSTEFVLGLGLGLGLGSHSSSHAPSHPPLLLAILLSHNIQFPRVY